MNRHPFRWDALAFGLFFLAVLGQWAVWERNLLDPDELAYVAAAALIVLGVLGIVGHRHQRQDRAPHGTVPPQAAADEVPDDGEPSETTPTDHDDAPTHGGNPA